VYGVRTGVCIRNRKVKIGLYDYVYNNVISEKVGETYSRPVT